MPVRTDMDAVLERAIRVIAEDRGASMGDIAARVGVSRATLTRLFSTREGMIDAMGRRILAHCEEVLEEARLDEAPVDEALAVLVRNYDVLAQLWSVVYVEADVLGVAELSDAADAVVERITAFVVRGQREGLFRTDMPAMWLASTLCSLAECAWELVGEGGMGERQAPDYLTKLLLDGARP
ncbi:MULTISPECIES: TetR/AcrR family transcriptional regulator [unclassified Streptomyces]|uniref:TetR/AcrR family transcriptional regulator n=1 Tax=unclassified Streptomyces TaxID=2593676 RepID=UPI002E327525|nr:TetR/AcrR family transcriptional regulator [Streptomyces sp. NBC_01356]WUC16268.1 TetR/AcrR family transcriptional regulator [Streptomyces sp. NBC_00564]WUC47320.1 TetR/AcrR family transcriptional regulator [Streptomyces sp. NBC_00554]